MLCVASSQWDYGAMTGKRTSLKYVSVVCIAEAAGLTVDLEFFEYVRAFEAGAIAASHEQPLKSVLNG